MTSSVFNPNCLAGKVVLISGGATGICYGISKSISFMGLQSTLSVAKLIISTKPSKVYPRKQGKNVLMAVHVMFEIKNKSSQLWRKLSTNMVELIFWWMELLATFYVHFNHWLWTALRRCSWLILLGLFYSRSMLINSVSKKEGSLLTYQPISIIMEHFCKHMLELPRPELMPWLSI